MEAHRGDLVVVEYRRPYLKADDQLSYDLERVTGVDRAGRVMRTARLHREHRGQGTYETVSALVTIRTRRGRPVGEWRPYATGLTWIVPQATYDLPAAWTACPARITRPPACFENLQQIRTFMSAYVRSRHSGTTTP
jgi:hypothetical protein